MRALRGSGWLVRRDFDLIRGEGWFFGRVDMRGEWQGRPEGPFPSHAAAAEALDRDELTTSSAMEENQE